MIGVAARCCWLLILLVFLVSLAWHAPAAVAFGIGVFVYRDPRPGIVAKKLWRRSTTRV